ncbi:putative signal peptidase [Mycena maculata]|uniref:Signal peptidase complex catalytic subunit SEC11 n=1 Tax=Mycena maculata TaxID=230809 RepID=A0AAD7MUJ0_9AGAR|nr:putative signal peptidase [Mycena maculata]
MLAIPVRHLLLQAQVVALALSTPYMMYTALRILTNCKSPVVVVLSGSMEPGIHRGDLLFLSNHMPQVYKNGDITVYQVPGEEISIVHRVVQTHTRPVNVSTPSFQGFLTKGDNNDEDDVTLYKGFERLKREYVVGKVGCIIPLIGYASILFNETHRVRYAMLAITALVNFIPRVH